MPRAPKMRKPASHKKCLVTGVVDGERTQTETSAVLKRGMITLTTQRSKGTTNNELPEEMKLGAPETCTMPAAVAHDVGPSSGTLPVAPGILLVKSLLQHGRFPKRPQHYLDLFTPLMEFFVYCMHPESAMAHVQAMRCSSYNVNEFACTGTEVMGNVCTRIPLKPAIVIETPTKPDSGCFFCKGVGSRGVRDAVLSKDLPLRHCCTCGYPRGGRERHIDPCEGGCTAVKGSSELNTSMSHYRFLQTSPSVPCSQRPPRSPVAGKSMNEVCLDSTLQPLREFNEELEAQLRLMTVVAFPMAVFPYFASHPLGDVATRDKFSLCSGNHRHRHNSHKRTRSEEIFDFGGHRKTGNNSNGDLSGSFQAEKCHIEKEELGNRRLETRFGEAFVRLPTHLEEFCRLHYDIDELYRLVYLLSNEAAAQYLPAFPDDNAYLMAKDATFVMEHWAASVIHGKFTPGLFALAHRAGLDLFKQAVPCIQAIAGIVGHHTRYRLKCMALRPRVQRLGWRLKLNAKEVEALTFLLLCHCGAMLCAAVSAPQTPATMAHHVSLTPKELMWFLSEQRLHMRQGLVTSDARQRNSFINSNVAMPQEVVTALTGDDLSEEQLIKLERTALAEVLNEERQQREQAVAGPASDKEVACPDVGTGRVRDHQQGPDSVSHLFQAAPHEDGSEDGFCTSSCSTRSVPVSNAGELEDANGTAGPSLGPPTPRGDFSTVAPCCDESNAVVPLENGEGSDSVRGCGLIGEPRKGAPSDSGQTAVASLVEPETCVFGEDGTALSTGGHSANLTSNECNGDDDSSYKTDLEYIEAAFNLIATFIRIRTAEGDIKDDEDCYQPKTKLEATLRELKGRQRVCMAVHNRRLQATLEQHAKGNGYLPRIEQLSQRLGLSELEKQVLLLMVGNVVSHDILIAINGRYVMREGQRVLTVGYILFVLCESLQERIAVRKSFYHSAPLIANNIISLSLDSSNKSRFNTDLMDYVCDIDRKIVDYLMGTETETAEMVPGSSLYHPTVSMGNVVLPAQTTELVFSTIENYSLFEQCKAKCGFGKGLGFGAGGLVILFYGPSGTGKTMLANAVAHELKKKILLVTVSEFRADKNAAEMMSFIFREARLNANAIIFFDECEPLFETREVNPLVTSLLADFEKYEGLIIMATNKAQNMDEAMNRRISLMIEFKLPGYELRENIWRSHIPSELKLHDDVSLEKLALNYELSGGLIRNAVLAALHHAVAREKTETPTLTMEDLESGARQQLRGLFLASQLPHGAASKFYVTPKRVLSELVVRDKTRKQVEMIANLAKSRSTLFSQWGFSQDACEDLGAVYLLSGPSGTGKSLAAEGIAFDCGATIRLCNLAELMLLQEVSIHTVFEEARSLGAIVVFDQAQGLFNYSERSLSISQMIQYHAMRYSRPVIIIATTRTSQYGDDGAMLGGGNSWIDVQAPRIVFSMHVVFSLPSRELRRELWCKAFPAKVPLAEDVDFVVLSNSVVSGKTIRTVAFNVCCQVALLPESRRKLDMKMILKELEAVLLREQGHNPSATMFA